MLSWIKKFWNWSVPLAPMHSGHPEASFGGKRVINAWGGYSKATKQALERLHYGGFLRIAHRQKGIRVYEALPTVAGSLSPDERLARVGAGGGKHPGAGAGENSALDCELSPATDRKSAKSSKDDSSLISAGKLERQVIDGLGYLWPAGTAFPSRRHATCVSWLHSIRWYGTAGALSIFGAGLTGLKPIRLRPSGSADTMRCRCCGAIR